MKSCIEPMTLTMIGEQLTQTVPSSLRSARSVGLTRPLKDVTVTAGESATFECELSYEGISVDWFLGGKKMEASERVSPVRIGVTGAGFYFLFFIELQGDTRFTFNHRQEKFW